MHILLQSYAYDNVATSYKIFLYSLQFLTYVCTPVEWFAKSCNSLSAIPVDQQGRSLEVIFYFRCCIMKSGVSFLARKIRLAIIVVVKSSITHISLHPIVLTSNFYCLDVFLILEKRHAKLQNFMPIRLNYSGPSG